MYVSRDVVFDENVFPFASLRPNAGARLRAELTLLPDILLNPFADFGDASLRDQTVVNSVLLMLCLVLQLLWMSQEQTWRSLVKKRGRSIHISCVPRWEAESARGPVLIRLDHLWILLHLRCNHHRDRRRQRTCLRVCRGWDPLRMSRLSQCWWPLVRCRRWIQAWGSDFPG